MVTLTLGRPLSDGSLVDGWMADNFIDSFREEGYGKDWTALPQFFKEHGWYTAGGGKVRFK